MPTANAKSDVGVLIGAIEVILVMIVFLLIFRYPLEIGVYANRFLGLPATTVGARDQDMQYHPEDLYHHYSR